MSSTTTTTTSSTTTTSTTTTTTSTTTTSTTTTSTTLVNVDWNASTWRQNTTIQLCNDRDNITHVGEIIGYPRGLNVSLVTVYSNAHTELRLLDSTNRVVKNFNIRDWQTGANTWATIYFMVNESVGVGACINYTLASKNITAVAAPAYANLFWGRRGVGTNGSYEHFDDTNLLDNITSNWSVTLGSWPTFGTVDDGRLFMENHTESTGAIAFQAELGGLPGVKNGVLVWRQLNTSGTTQGGFYGMLGFRRSTYSAGLDWEGTNSVRVEALIGGTASSCVNSSLTHGNANGWNTMGIRYYQAAGGIYQGYFQGEYVCNTSGYLGFQYDNMGLLRRTWSGGGGNVITNHMYFDDILTFVMQEDDGYQMKLYGWGNESNVTVSAPMNANCFITPNATARTNAVIISLNFTDSQPLVDTVWFSNGTSNLTSTSNTSLQWNRTHAANVLGDSNWTCHWNLTTGASYSRVGDNNPLAVTYFNPPAACTVDANLSRQGQPVNFTLTFTGDTGDVSAVWFSNGTGNLTPTGGNGSVWHRTYQDVGFIGEADWTCWHTLTNGSEYATVNDKNPVAFTADMNITILTPANESSSYSMLITASYNVSLGAGNARNCSVMANTTGPAYTAQAYNQTPIVLGENNIAFPAPRNGNYSWGVRCLGSQWWSSQNYTFTQNASTPNVTGCAFNQSEAVEGEVILFSANYTLGLWPGDAMLFIINGTAYPADSNDTTSFTLAFDTTSRNLTGFAHTLSCAMNDSKGHESTFVDGGLMVWLPTPTLGSCRANTSHAEQGEPVLFRLNASNTGAVSNVWVNFNSTAHMASGGPASWTWTTGTGGLWGPQAFSCSLNLSNSTVYSRGNDTALAVSSTVSFTPGNVSRSRFDDATYEENLTLHSSFLVNKTALLTVVDCPGGWTCSISPTSAIIPLQGSRLVTVSYSIPSGTLETTYTFQAGANATETTANASFTIGSRLNPSGGGLGSSFIALMTDLYGRLKVRLDNMVAGVDTRGARYRVQVADNINFGNPTLDRLTAEMDVPIEAGNLTAGRWYWRVRRQMENASSRWSETRTFDVV